MLPGISSAGNIECKYAHEGIFKKHGVYGSLNVITRTKEKQTETYGMSGLVVEYDISWTSDCTFILYNRKIVSGSERVSTISNLDSIYNEITESNSDWNKIAYTINGWEPKKEENFFAVDTSYKYRDLNNLDKFKGYDENSVGGTFIGYNYSVVYKQHSKEKNKYSIAFLEALMFGEKSKFKMIANVECYLNGNQRITITNCRFNDKYDKEIVAVYDSINPDAEATIFKAWRFNKSRLKIEEVDPALVKYKVADKNIVPPDSTE